MRLLRGPRRRKPCGPPRPPPRRPCRRWRLACATRRLATPTPSPITTTSPTASTNRSRPLHGLHLRGLPLDDATLEEAQAVKFDLVCRKLALQAGRCACWTSAPAGAAWSCTPPRSTASRPSGSPSRRRRRRGRSARSPSAACHELAEVRHLDYRDVTESDFDAVSSIGLTEHIGARNLAVLLRFLRRQAAPARPHAQPLHHAAVQPRAASRAAGSSTATSSPTASSRDPADRLGDARPRTSRCATRRTCASTTRRPCATGAPTWTRDWERGGRRGR